MERFLFTKMFMLIVITLVLQMYGCKGCLEKERIALLEIKALIINVKTVMVDDHNLSDCCDWYQVECNTTTGRVMNLSLYDLLYYSTPILNFSMFQPFEELQSLNLSRNYFEGWVDSRGKLSSSFTHSSYILDLGWNFFNSSILSYLTTLTSLKTLILRLNNLEDFNTEKGAGLANLRNLEFLDLSSTRISGSTLQELGLANLRNLKFLDLSANEINGTLQELGLANLRNLKFLDLSANEINGTLQELDKTDLNENQRSLRIKLH
ncbi:hypothetical protein ACOSP7_013743 [Xanthoceras sorbifolium]